MALMIFYKKGSALFTDDEKGERLLSKMGDGELVEVDIKRTRNLIQHRKFWKLCQYIGEATGRTSEEVAGLLKLMAGHCDVVEVNGNVYKIARSIAFAAMDDTEFDPFFNRACQEVCVQFVPHLTADFVREEIERMVGIRYDAR